MIEALAFAGFVLALIAFLGGRKTAERLETELTAIKAELARRAPLPEESAAELAGVEQAPTIAAAPVATALPVTQSATVSLELAEDAASVEKAARGEPLRADPAPAAIDAVQPRPRESLESRLGARWAVWVGGIALALGGVFMVKVAVDTGLLSPAVRLVLAAVFGLLLMAVGEFIRRRAVPLIADAYRNAMIPGILTAAGSVSLFGVCYAAYGIYGYFGPTTAFLLLTLISLATIGLSLLHGQALAGLGLLASLLTPALVSSESPSPWALFGFLSIAWLGTLAASRLRRWTVVPALANMGLCLWALAYISLSEPFQTLPLTLCMVVVIAGTGLIWPGASRLSDIAGDAPESDRVSEENLPRGILHGPWFRLFAPPAVAVSVTAAIAVVVVALAMVNPLFRADGSPVASFLCLVALLALWGAVRVSAVYAAIAAALAAIAGLWNMTAADMLLSQVQMLDGSLTAQTTAVAAVSGQMAMLSAMILSAIFIVLGGFALRLRLREETELATVWAAILAVVPVALLSTSFFMTGNLTFDAPHGLFSLAAAAVLGLFAELISRRETSGPAAQAPLSFVVWGAFGLIVLALHALTNGIVTTLLLSLVGFSAIGLVRIRPWPVLPWIMAGAAIVVLGRIAWEPTIVGAAALGKTPVFNALLPGYGIPAALLVISAFLLRDWPGVRIRNLLQALASLFALLTAAILVRHAMNGGVLDSAVPTLAEQSIYTLLAIGGSAILMSLDFRSPSPVFRYGSLTVGILSMLSILSAHLIGLNPYFSGEFLGRWPVLDLLLIGYLLPGLGYAGLARYARDRRPPAYVTALAVSGAVLVFAWATLSVRRFWQGQSIADWKGFLQGETYTYSVAWLLLGVALLALGSRFKAKSVRIASAVLVFVAVLKVFLIDMANLEGFLRALSFIGLGAVLIGIGLFYQKILSGGGAGTGKAAPPLPAEEKPA